MTGVLDANPVINLAKGEVFHYLSRRFTPLYLPPSVEQEVIDQGEGLFGSRELKEALGNWIETVAPGRRALTRFPGRSLGDREVLAIAWEKRVDVILTDDLRIATRAAALNIPSLGVRDLLLLFKRQSDIQLIKPVLDLMASRHYGITPTLYQQLLRTAGEGD